MTSGCRGTHTVFQDIRPGAGFETGDFVQEKLGGAAVERLGYGGYSQQNQRGYRRLITRVSVPGTR